MLSMADPGPVVLHPSGNGHERFIGDVYVPGVMDVELMSGYAQ